jgi:hypothetical protein
MPRGDGTGPSGQGPETGRGLRRGIRGQRRGGGFGAGPGGFCICSNCGTEIPHEIGRACFEEICPKCGKTMTRK